jgi:uncharacterized protein (DUF58 family)
VTVRAAPKLGAYLSIGGAGLLAALLLGRPEPAVIASGLLLAVTAGLLLAGRPAVEVEVEMNRDHVLEGDEVTVTTSMHALTVIPEALVGLKLPPTLRPPDGVSDRAVSLRRGERRQIELVFRCLRWGGHVLGEVDVQCRDRLGFFVGSRSIEVRLPLRVYPRPEQLVELVPAAETQVLTGNEVSRQKSDGIEFADVRPFVPGDRVRRVNWRISARRGELHVNELHPERNTDVVIFLDTFVELRQADVSSLDLCVRAAAALVTHYLARRDRVGLVGFGGTLRWLRPAMGRLQLYRLVEALLDTDVAFSYAWKGIDALPRRTLPAKSLVIALSPLVDERSVPALLDLSGRGYDLAIIEIPAEAFVGPGTTESDQLAYRLWTMEREGLRDRYRAQGVAVATWDGTRPVQAVLEEVRAFRRYARHLRV